MATNNYNQLLAAYVQGNEGYRKSVYNDTLGNPTVGVGLNLNDPVTSSLLPPDVQKRVRPPTDSELKDAYSKRLNLAAKDTTSWLGPDAYTKLDDARRMAATDMAYQMGGPGLSKFVNTRTHIQSGDWAAAADQLLSSVYAKQTPQRAYRNAYTMLTGQPYDPRAILQFQKANGLTADGVVGPQTWSKLRRLYDSKRK